MTQNSEFTVVPSVGENLSFIKYLEPLGFRTRNFFKKLLRPNLDEKKVHETMKCKEIALIRGGRTVYYSPFNRIPSYLPSERNDRYFLTVYDLIPLKFPEFFKDNPNIKVVDDIVVSLDRKMGLFCISQCTKNDLLAWRTDLDKDKINVTHLAASNLFFPEQNREKISRIKEKYKIPVERKYILSLATIEPRKNTTITLKAFKLLIEEQQHKDLILVLVGTKGWIDSEFEAGENVIVTGYAEDQDLAALYSGAECFVYPSFYEGFGLPPLEAMKCGVPVITSNTSSLPEVVGDAGVMVGPNDIDELRKTIGKMVSDRCFHSELTQKALARSRQFSWDKTVAIMTESFRTQIS